MQIAFGLIGIATLMPWSIFVTATDYWMYKFRDVNASHTGVPHPNKTEMQTFFVSYLSIASNVPFLVMLIINSLFAQRLVTQWTTATVSHTHGLMSQDRSARAHAGRHRRYFPCLSRDDDLRRRRHRQLYVQRIWDIDTGY